MQNMKIMIGSVKSKEEMHAEVKFFKDQVILSSNGTQKTIPILSKHEAEMKNLFDTNMKHTKIDREVQWNKLLPPFNVKQLLNPNCCLDLKKRVLENDQLYLVDMKHLWKKTQISEIPCYWEEHCQRPFPKTLGYALFDASDIIMPFTGKITKKLFKKYIYS